MIYADPKQCRIERTSSTAALMGPDGRALIFMTEKVSDKQLWYLLDILNITYEFGWNMGRAHQMSALLDNGSLSMQEAS
ncbi:hypothetical protein LZ24_02490 [Desulfobotulus alkaliphilus]|uniref:Uncharacterized protein n=1 Tax=Desulfobotulus alkaliphilus TaxID=622671 RepID=A0A562RHM2_9BACT|nr:hypothetical protein [Desulfobotulus alkaliphilus]TWI68518.1 hypothetical protein LZ24_02490 [Desulfobotulus alkaliphilus]